MSNQTENTHFLRPKNRAEAGQAIILIAMLMVALAGMTGLAIDGGGLYFLHRDTQNAADAAILAATYALCTNGDLNAIKAAGFAAAEENGFRNHDDLSTPEEETWDPNSTLDWVIVDRPWSEPAASRPDAQYFIEVSVSAVKPTYFIQFVYGGQPLRVTSGGVGKCTPSNATLLPPGALNALNTGACNALRSTGNGDVETHGAGIFVNSNASEAANPNCDSVGGTGNGHITADGDGLQAVGTEPKCLGLSGGNAQLTGDLTCGVAPVAWNPLADIAPPDAACVESAPRTVPSGSTITLDPGYYPLIRINNGTTVTFNPGLYCIEEFDIHGGNINGEGVVFYFPEDGLGLHFNGTPNEINFSAPTDDNCIDGLPSVNTCDWIGLLIWSDAGTWDETSPGTVNHLAEVHLNGGAGTPADPSMWVGLVYGPRSECILEGTGTLEVHGQVICNIVDLNGSGGADIYYEEAGFLNTPPVIAVVS